MKRFTEKYVRTNSKWVKILRDNERRIFSFAVGNKGEYEAYDIKYYPFGWYPNWADAIARAKDMIQ